MFIKVLDFVNDEPCGKIDFKDLNSNNSKQ